MQAFSYSRFLPVLLVMGLILTGCDSNDPVEDLIIEDITVGTGEEVQAGQVLTVHYVLTDIDGRLITSSTIQDRVTPFAFEWGVGAVLEGWDLGLEGMRVGGRRQLTIPPSLAYGNRNVQGIPPNSTLIFDILLLHIEGELEIEDIAEGTGAEVTQGATITVNYEGRYIDDTVFDSSFDRGTPFSFRLGLGQVISGWEQGLVGMREGGTRRLVIPSDLAYGTTGSPGGIPPLMTLVFDVEIVSVSDS